MMKIFDHRVSPRKLNIRHRILFCTICDVSSLLPHSSHRQKQNVYKSCDGQTKNSFCFMAEFLFTFQHIQVGIFHIQQNITLNCEGLRDTCFHGPSVSKKAIHIIQTFLVTKIHFN